MLTGPALLCRGSRTGLASLSALLSAIDAAPQWTVFGRVTAIQGLMVEASFGLPSLAVGTRVRVSGADGIVLEVTPL